jgi:hypothetical protein
VFKLRGTTKHQFVADAIHLTIKHFQMYTHHHATMTIEVVEAYRQTHGFNDYGL